MIDTKNVIETHRDHRWLVEDFSHLTHGLTLLAKDIDFDMVSGNALITFYDIVKEETARQLKELPKRNLSFKVYKVDHAGKKIQTIIFSKCQKLSVRQALDYTSAEIATLELGLYCKNIEVE